MDTSKTLVENHIALANKIASQKKRSLPKHIDIEELRSAAYLGLCEAASRYNPDKGVAFSTFAYPRIWGAVIDHLREMGMYMISLDASAGDEGCIGETIPAPVEPTDREEVLEVVARDLGTQAKDVLRLYFYEDVSMKEVGRRYGVTESRISQMLAGYKKDIRKHWDFNSLQEEIAA